MHVSSRDQCHRQKNESKDDQKASDAQDYVEAFCGGPYGRAWITAGWASVLSPDFDLTLAGVPFPEENNDGVRVPERDDQGSCQNSVDQRLESGAEKD